MGSRENQNTLPSSADYSDYQLFDEISIFYFWCLQNTKSRFVDDASYDCVQRLSKGGAEEANYVTGSI